MNGGGEGEQGSAKAKRLKMGRKKQSKRFDLRMGGRRSYPGGGIKQTNLNRVPLESASNQRHTDLSARQCVDGLRDSKKRGRRPP